MNDLEILQHYSKGDLRKLAKGKIAEIVGLDADKILKDLSRVLGNYESVKRNIEFRNPPADTILEVLLEADGHRVRVDELKRAVQNRIGEYRAESKSLSVRDPARGYQLYATMLAEAWGHDGDLVPAEANLLRILRRELGITRRSHQLIMAHSDISEIVFKAHSFDEEMAFLSNEGIVLVCSEGGESFFVLSEETAQSLLQLWGFEMQPKQYARLLESLSNVQLARILKSVGSRFSGSNSELITRILASEIPPSKGLESLSSSELASLLGKLGLLRGGTKEDRVLRVADYFKADSDLVVTSPDEVVEEPTPEVRVLKEEAIADLLDDLTMAQIASILDSLELQRSGSKAARIERLVKSIYSSESILHTLRMEDIRDLACKIGLRRSGAKAELIHSIIGAYRDREIEDSPLTSIDLLQFYSEIAKQDRRAYPAEARAAGLSATRIGLDFERATRHIFKNMLNLDTKAARPGREDPDGTLTDDDGRFYCYECKTVLNPPYSLPISHRLQIRNYISAIGVSRRAEQFGGYLVISHSFTEDIGAKLAEIERHTEPVPLAVITAHDLLAFARKWQREYPIETFPVGRALKDGQITARDLDKVAK